jgi:hypothetical protein
VQFPHRRLLKDIFMPLNIAAIVSDIPLKIDRNLFKQTEPLLLIGKGARHASPQKSQTSNNSASSRSHNNCSARN